MAKPEHARAAFYAANEFLEASERCSGADWGAGGPSFLPGPEALTAAFACELYLKALILRRLDEQEGHNLSWLFNKGLNESERNAVGTEFEKQEYLPGCDLARLVDSFARAFVEWRYLYEQPTLQLDIGALRAFARALYLTIRALSPEWQVRADVHERITTYDKDKLLMQVHIGADLNVPAWIGQLLKQVRPTHSDLAKMEGVNLSLTAPTLNLNDEPTALKAQIRRSADPQDRGTSESH